jgi:hypothetical protein
MLEGDLQFSSLDLGNPTLNVMLSTGRGDPCAYEHSQQITPYNFGLRE